MGDISVTAVDVLVIPAAVVVVTDVVVQSQLKSRLHAHTFSRMTTNTIFLILIMHLIVFRAYPSACCASV